MSVHSDLRAITKRVVAQWLWDDFAASVRFTDALERMQYDAQHDEDLARWADDGGQA